MEDYKRLLELMRTVKEKYPNRMLGTVEQVCCGQLLSDAADAMAIQMQQLAEAEAARSDMGRKLAAACKARDELATDNHRLNEAYEAMSKDLLAITDRLKTAERDLNSTRKLLEMARGERDIVTERMIQLEEELAAMEGK